MCPTRCLVTEPEFSGQPVLCWDTPMVAHPHCQPEERAFHYQPLQEDGMPPAIASIRELLMETPGVSSINEGLRFS